MPAKLWAINTMTKEILAAIPTIGTKDPYLGKPVPPTRFESWKFSPPDTSILSKTLRRAREGIWSALAIEKIYIEWGTRLKDMWNKITGNVVNSRDVAVHGLIFKRDREKMEETQKAINNKKYAISIGGWRTSSIKWKIFEKIEAIIERYKKAGLLDNRSTIAAWVTYGSLINSLDELNILAKAQMAKTQTNIMKNDLERDGILRKINEQAANEIIQSYQCALLQKCNNNITQIKQDRKKLIEWVKSGSIGARQQIEIANQKLAATVNNTFKKTKENKQNAETIALKNRFWLKSIQIQDAGLLWYKSPRRRSQRQEVKEWANSMLWNSKDNLIGLFGYIKTLSLYSFKFAINIPNLTNKMLKEIGKLFQKQNDDSDTPEIKNNPQTIEFKTTMITNADKIFNDADEQYDYVMMSDNKDILTRFGTLSDKLLQLKETVGEKTTNNWLIKNFGEVCELQCSNIRSKKCYY